MSRPSRSRSGSVDAGAKRRKSSRSGGKSAHDPSASHKAETPREVRAQGALPPAGRRTSASRQAAVGAAKGSRVSGLRPDGAPSLQGVMWALPEDRRPPVERPRTTPEPAATGYSKVLSRADRPHPTLDAYLAALPDGLDSFPAARVRGLILRMLVQDPIHPHVVTPGLPPMLEQLARTPPAADGWFPQVWLSALHALAYDRAFADDGGMPAFEEWTYKRALRELRAPLYQPLFRGAGATQLFTSFATTWPSLYRGIPLRTLEVGNSTAVFQLSYPPNGVPPVSRGAIAGALRAAAVVGGAAWATASAAEESIRAAQIQVRWG